MSRMTANEWKVIMKVIAAIATTLLGVFGAQQVSNN